MSFIKGHKRSQLDLDSVVHKKVTIRSRYGVVHKKVTISRVVHKKVTIRSRYSVVHKRSQLDLDIVSFIKGHN